MHMHIKIFKCNLQKCIADCIDILKERKNDRDAQILITELKYADTFVDALTEQLLKDILLQFITAIGGVRQYIKDRDVSFFDDVNPCTWCKKSTGICICKVACHGKCACLESCLNCNDFLSSMDIKTFKAIKKIVKDGDKENIAIMFDYIDAFISSGDKYRQEVKEKTL